MLTTVLLGVRGPLRGSLTASSPPSALVPRSSAATAAANRRKGARWEADLRNGLRNSAYDTEALRLHGKDDEGDLVVRPAGSRLVVPDFIVIEAKDAAMNVTDFVRQAILEGDNFAKHRDLDRDRVTGVAVVKRRGKNWRESLVLTTLAEYMKLNTP